MDTYNISRIGSNLSLRYIMFQCIEYRRQREYDASEGVTAEDAMFRHGTTGWIDY